MKTLPFYKQATKLALLFIALSSLLLTSCSSDDNSTPAQTTDKHAIAGKYEFQIVPMMMGTKPVATGTVQGDILQESNGVYRLVFKGFRQDPMPFVMSVDTKFTVEETTEGLSIHQVKGEGYFDGNVPEGGVDPTNNPGFELPGTVLEGGLHSQGKSVLKGTYDKATKVFHLDLDPAVGLPVNVKITSLKKM